MGQQGRVSRRLAGLAALTLLIGGTTGCAGDAGDPAPGEDAAAEASASPGGTPDSATPAPPRDSYADVEPATQAPPRVDMPGIARVAVWEDAEVRASVDAVVAAVETPAGIVSVTVGGLDGLAADDDSEAARAYWMEHNTETQGRVRVADPVVVDGVEMARARGRLGTDVVEAFFHADGEATVEAIFMIPASMGEAEREEWIGRVLVTLELA